MADRNHRSTMRILYWLIRSAILKTNCWHSDWNLPFLINLCTFIDVWFLENDTWHNSDSVSRARGRNWNRYHYSVCRVAGDRRSRNLGRLFPWLTYLRVDTHAILVRTCLGFYELGNYRDGPRHNCLIQIWLRSHYNQHFTGCRL